MSKIIDAIFPIYADCVCNNIVRNKIKECINPTTSEIEKVFDSVSTSVYKEHYVDTFTVKKTLEEKAKTNIVGVTIATSLITGASSIINIVYIKFSSPIIKWSVFAVIIAAMMYMVLSGLLAIKILISDNKMFVVNIKKLSEGEKTVREEYNKAITLNSYYNTIRNNSIFTSYECIRNSLICLFVILILTTIPAIYSTSSDSQTRIVNMGGVVRHYQFMYSDKAVNSMKVSNSQDIIEDIVINNLKENRNTSQSNIDFGIADINNKVFIKYRYTNNMVYIMLVESISN